MVVWYIVGDISEAAVYWACNQEGAWRLYGISQTSE